jgi:hypothetical protein
VELSAQLTINAGTNAHANGLGGTVELSGLHVTGTAHVAVVGAPSARIAFNENGQSGILVDQGASVKITGAPAAGNAKSTVVANGNKVDGIEIRQEGSGLPLNDVTGLLATKNGQDGARILAGSQAKMRNCVLLGNVQNGVQIASVGTGGNATFDVSGIDLGTGMDWGLNVLQDPSAPNAGTGVCLNIPPHRSQTLAARGNTWVTGAPATSVDCSMSAGTLTEDPNRACTGATDIGGYGLAFFGAMGGNGVDVQMCACGGNASICQ